MSSAPSITITQLDGYKFVVDFGALVPDLVVDETPPYGRGEGPSPEQMLVTGVANCLCASLVFALGKYRQEAGAVSATATASVARNAEGRLRLQGIDVRIATGAPAAAMPRIGQVLAQFERFCTVSESVKAGIPVTVSVSDGDGVNLREPGAVASPEGAPT